MTDNQTLVMTIGWQVKGKRDKIRIVIDHTIKSMHDTHQKHDMITCINSNVIFTSL